MGRAQVSLSGAEDKLPLGPQSFLPVQVSRIFLGRRGKREERKREEGRRKEKVYTHHMTIKRKIKAD